MANERLTPLLPYITDRFLDLRACDISWASFGFYPKGILALTFDSVEHAQAFVGTVNSDPALRELLYARQGYSSAKNKAAIVCRNAPLTEQMVQSLLGIELGTREAGTCLL